MVTSHYTLTLLAGALESTRTHLLSNHVWSLDSLSNAGASHLPNARRSQCRRFAQARFAQAYCVSSASVGRSADGSHMATMKNFEEQLLGVAESEVFGLLWAFTEEHVMA